MCQEDQSWDSLTEEIVQEFAKSYRPRERERIEGVVFKLWMLWNRVDQWRFTQLIENVLGCNRDECIFSIQDDEFERRLDVMLETTWVRKD